MMEANQEQQTASESTGTPNAAKEGNRASQIMASTLERIRSGEFKARLHYFLFRHTQQAKASDSLLSKYKRRLRDDWQKWVGIGTGAVGLIMLFSPEEFWLWQIPLAFILTLVAPIFFEIPAALNSLFGHTEQQHLVGKTITLTRPIVDGRGQTILEGREWQVSGPDCQAGQEVRIVTLDAKTLYVIQANNLKRGTLA